MKDKWALATKIIHAGHIKDSSGALVAPLCQSATFVFDSAEQGGARFAGDETGYIYTRLGNPTTAELERKMAVLEGTQAAVATASGMAAVSSALLANLSHGDHLVASKAVYGCTFSLMNNQLSKFGIAVTLVDFSDPQAISKAITPQTKVLFCETPVNPHLDVFDLDEIVAIAKKHGLISIVDNTFMTPLLQQPILHGVDLVVHSATKYLNGHGDVIAGVICGTSEQIDKIKFETVKDLGGVLSPHDAWLILRGLKTLDVRVERHCDNAERVVEYLLSHPKVIKVHYPGLKGSKGESLMGKQMRRGGGVIAFELDADLKASIAFVNHLQLFSIAVSLGDAESLIQHPASMTHATYDIEQREAAGIGESLLRISVGLEAAEDIIVDLEQGLAQV
ncbi:PLP-dependent aspartate aminotransferase family protein [Shewanella eurypsychrophilus]|uniref:PLP-dependent aspartate aminotransferase family protein n=1 Tax=Shewanella eurypsychrophilus TaxID=2593656 RepID=A0ABX6V6Z9_9GAMM|nr:MULTISPECIES: PLP-dependent aspartate aminotransferase family protein [Shewanella]QFU22046.1 aminotransferase class I/II-fold pyridoxal phosphate-dependent enzyme [Shewanella sp. YLB-09]QPG57335.1 PLP-dependent aspartate aminotransferase family protein [Shewanella eurypsychrophilus]